MSGLATFPNLKLGGISHAWSPFDPLKNPPATQGAFNQPQPKNSPLALRAALGGMGIVTGPRLSL
jgi:hypothetical protein